MHFLSSNTIAMLKVEKGRFFQEIFLLVDYGGNFCYNIKYICLKIGNELVN